MKKGTMGLLSLGLCAALLAGPVLAAEGAVEARGALTAVDAAGFTDADQIGQWEAVSALARLGVITGKDDGSFDPAGTVTRAEAAKMLYGMGQGKADIAQDTPAAFADMDGHWAREAVEYCRAWGVIGGRGDGIFAPDDTVTAMELCKMALTALGYDPVTFGLVGVDWEIGTNMLANGESKLYDGLEEMDRFAPISRENTARVLYNMLKAPVMEGTLVEDEETGETVTVYTVKTDEAGESVSFLKVYFGLEELPGTAAVEPEGEQEG